MVVREDSGTWTNIKGWPLEVKVVIALYVIVLAALYIIYTWEDDRVQSFAWIGGFVVIVMLLLFLKGRRLLTMREAVNFAYKDIKESQKLGELPTGRIQFYMEGKLQKVNLVPQRYELGFKIVGKETIYVAGVDCYTGYVEKMTETKEWKATDSPDTQVIIVPDIYTAIVARKKVEDDTGKTVK
jgi:hypothetical protein